MRRGTGMTLQARGGANAARSRTVPMLAALAPLLIFIGIDGVVHGVARSAFPQGKLISPYHSFAVRFARGGGEILRSLLVTLSFTFLFCVPDHF